MKRLFLNLFVITAMVTGCASASRKADSASFHVRPFQTQTLPNGLTILWIPDQSLPYVSLQMMVKSGSSQDPVGKEGLASFTANMLPRGTAKRNAVQISEDLDQIGSGFSAMVEPDYMILSSSSLSFDRANELGQFQELVLNPSFPQKEIERERQLELAGLKKLADRPEAFSGHLFSSFLFGSHPYGHDSEGMPRSIRTISRGDIEAFYKHHFTPENSVLAVVGQFDEQWKSNVVNAFKDWKKTPTRQNPIPAFPKWDGLQVLLVNRPDLNQAQIQIGFKGVPRNIPEYIELRAALKILGESFGSRLFDEIRVKRGLTYGIYSWFDPRQSSGPMGIYTFTRVEKVGETVNETLKTYREFVKDGVTADEVSTVKALMRGEFPRTFETPEVLARQLLILNRYGISSDYLTNYYTHLDKISQVSINQTIHKYFDPQNLRILVYAPAKSTEASLKKLGKLEIKNYKDFLQ